MVDESLLSAALEISQQRAELMRNIRTAILSNDLQTALQIACRLVGISEKEVAPHLESVPARITTELRLASEDAGTI